MQQRSRHHGARGLVLMTLVLSLALTQRVIVQQVVPFEVCARSDAWTRPSVDVQTRIWDDARYRDIGPNAYEWTHSFIPAETDSASIQYSISNLSGIWTDAQTNRCRWRGGDRGKWTEIWSLNYHIEGISLTGVVYRITVAPRERGYEIIQFRRPQTLGASRASLLFITGDDHVLREWRETEPSAFDPR